MFVCLDFYHSKCILSLALSFVNCLQHRCNPYFGLFMISDAGNLGNDSEMELKCFEMRIETII